ncbi:peroxisome proliferator-activated receptor gamma coactivator-related protein 1 isoform X2 [Colossoma macropomum]|uniref:peroxisome proliferator-activated receptor gamma coactivator-related protein 1 isoform X2 n=1 Tax=Colossoma macropomum TaxID=42526 RepID=UPI0018652D7D|nr:peroxisome proliferator-activated receptor gamma coactivator-related protein 1 isoform X2 [Colossoma macropomum]
MTTLAHLDKGQNVKCTCDRYCNAEILQDGLCSLQHHGLDTGDTLEALQSCLDPSILSIFEDSPVGEVKTGVDEESEATLLTALTEILDNVDDENLSPFDSLPDAELLQGQKGHEHASLRKFISLSRSPPEKESMLSSRQFPGKTLPFTSNGSLQRCDEERDDESSSMLVQDLGVSSVDDLDWCLPIFLEQDGESVSVNLNDLVKRIHPYSMTLCMEGEEQLLPEGGIVLEVIDNGEHGEPILAIPDLSVPLSLPSGDSAEGEQRVPENNTEKPSLKPEDISAEGVRSSEVSLVENGIVENVVTKQPKEESKKCPSKRKKKRKTDGAQLVEGRVLRSASSKRAVEEPIKEPQEHQKKKKKVTFAPVPSVAKPEMCKVENSSEMKTTEVANEIPSLTLITTTPTVEAPPREVCTKVIESKSLSVPEDKLIPVALPLEKCGESESSKEEPVLSPLSEPKPKSLSLQQYRLLRQHKKPPSPEKTGDNSTKWPSLPETPKELPPIPCLPDPNPRDPRRASTPAKKEPAAEIMPAWQPRGPAAPPTPEALLIPPASMLASSRKPEPPKSAPPPPSKPVENSASVQPSSVVPSVQPSPPKLSISTNVPQNTIPRTVSPAAKQTPLEMPVSLPVAATNGASQSLYAAGQTKCLQDTPATSAQVINVIPSGLPSKVQDISKPQAMTEIATRTTTNVQTSNAITNKPNAAVPLKRVAEQAVGASVPELAKPPLPANTTRPAVGSQRHVAPIAAQPFTSAPIQARIVKLAEQMRLASVPVAKAKSPTAELIESFTSEIGIEAADLTSLLEQFEETQPKEEQSLPEVCGRAAAVGNSSAEQHSESKALKKASSPDLASTAGLTPPATPPHQMWKPLAPVALLGKPKNSEGPKPTPTKAIQIEPRPLNSGKLPSKPQASVTLGPTQPFSLDHDYCVLPKEASQKELGSRWNIKQQSSIMIKSIELPSNHSAPQQRDSKLVSAPFATGSIQTNLKPSQPPLCESQPKKEALTSTVMVTPDASPDRMDTECSLQDENNSRRQKFQGYSERSPSPYHHKRGRSQRTYRTRICSSSGSRSSSSESSRSRSRSPSRKRYRSGHSGSSSRSPSRCRSRSRSYSRSPSPPRRRRYSYSSSCSGSWSRSQSRSRSRSSSRSRSRSPPHRQQHWNTHLGPYQRANYRYDSRDDNKETRRLKEKAIEERRVVYVGRIHGGMTRKELRERFLYFGEIEDCTVHFREQGDNYGFVTYYSTKDAFNAIENGSKLRQPNELPFDLCFGGRRQFCKTSYADLDSNQDYDPAPAKRKFDALDFDTLLKQAQRNLKR